jgi:xanthine/CO dehydrogenase XdhC/CoxF family maturation factor
MMIGGPSSAFMAGGVSGGCLEEFIARRGRALTEQRSSALLSFAADPDADHSDAPSLGCGGSIDVLVERLTPDHLAFLRRFATAHEADQASTAACLIDTSATPDIAVRRILWADGNDLFGNETIGNGNLGVPSTNPDPQIELLRQRSRWNRCVDRFGDPSHIERSHAGAVVSIGQHRAAFAAVAFCCGRRLLIIAF